MIPHKWLAKDPALESRATRSLTMNEMTSLLRRTALCSGRNCFFAGADGVQLRQGRRQDPDGRHQRRRRRQHSGGSVKLITVRRNAREQREADHRRVRYVHLAERRDREARHYGAAMDVNMGQGFRERRSHGSSVVPCLREPVHGRRDAFSTQLLDDGPQPCTESTPNTGTCLNMSLYSVYHPAILAGRKDPRSHLG